MITLNLASQLDCGRSIFNKHRMSSPPPPPSPQGGDCKGGRIVSDNSGILPHHQAPLNQES